MNILTEADFRSMTSHERSEFAIKYKSIILKYKKLSEEEKKTRPKLPILARLAAPIVWIFYPRNPTDQKWDKYFDDQKEFWEERKHSIKHKSKASMLCDNFIAMNVLSKKGVEVLREQKPYAYKLKLYSKGLEKCDFEAAKMYYNAHVASYRIGIKFLNAIKGKVEEQRKIEKTMSRISKTKITLGKREDTIEDIFSVLGWAVQLPIPTHAVIKAAIFIAEETGYNINKMMAYVRNSLLITDMLEWYVKYSKSIAKNMENDMQTLYRQFKN